MAETPAEPNNLVGKTLAGRFKLLRVIGEGGMAMVYAGTADGKPPEIAVKVMNAELAEDKTVLRRFAREAQAAFRLEHPTLVKVHHQGVDGEHAFLVMDLVRGQNLHQVLTVRKRLPQARAARIVVDVCAGLAVAHDQGIVHRDLKPGNIMLVEGGDGKGGDRVKILDFGIAKMLDTVPQSPEAKASREQMKTVTQSVLTRVGTIVGTPAYMSPEQCMAKSIDGRSDLYTLGVLLFEMVTGELPFEGDSPLHVAMKHAHEPAPLPTKVYSRTHAKLEKLIMRALQKDPAARFESALAFGDALAELLPELDKEAAPPPPARLGGGMKLERAVPLAVSKTALSASPVIAEVDDEKSTGQIPIPVPVEVVTPAPPDAVRLAPPRPQSKTMMGVGTVGAAPGRKLATTLQSPGGGAGAAGQAPVVLQATSPPRRTAWDDRPLPDRPDRPAPDSDDSDNVRTLAREGPARADEAASAAPTPPKLNDTLEPPTPNVRLPYAPTAVAPPDLDLSAAAMNPKPYVAAPPAGAQRASGTQGMGPNQTLMDPALRAPQHGSAVQPGQSLSASGPHAAVQPGQSLSASGPHAAVGAPMAPPPAPSAPGGSLRGTVPLRAWVEGGNAPGAPPQSTAGPAGWQGGASGPHAPVQLPLGIMPPPTPPKLGPSAAAIQTRSLVVGIMIGMLAVGVLALALAFILR